MDPGLLGNFIIVISLLLLPIYLARQVVPGPYRLTMRLIRRLGDFAVFRQAKRRGMFFAIFVHFFMIVGLVLVVLGLMTATFGAIMSGLVFVAIATVAYRVLGALRRVRARHRSMPTWRR
jgi:hypothetical protein